MNDTTNNPKGLFRCASEIALKVLEIEKRWEGDHEELRAAAQATIQSPSDLQALRALQVGLVHRRQTGLVRRLRAALNSFIVDLVEAQKAQEEAATAQKEEPTDLDILDQNAPFLPFGDEVADQVQAVRDATTDRETLEALVALKNTLPRPPRTPVQLGSVRAANRMLQAAVDAFPVRHLHRLKEGDVFFIEGNSVRLETLVRAEPGRFETDKRFLSPAMDYARVRLVEAAPAPAFPPFRSEREALEGVLRYPFQREGARVGIPALPPDLTPEHVHIYDAETGRTLEFEIAEVAFDGGRVGIGLKNTDYLAPVRSALSIINLDSEDPFDRRFQAAAALRAATFGPGDVVAVCARVADALETEGGKTTWNVLNEAESALQGLF